MVTLFAVVPGWVGWELDQRRKEKVVVAWIEEMGGTIHSVAEFPPSFDKRSWWEKTEDRWFGEKVLVVSLSDTPVSDLSPLAGLKNLKWLVFENTNVSDLSPLSELTNLEMLALQNTQVSDLSPIASLKNLLDLAIGQVSAKVIEQVQELQQALPNCRIDYHRSDDRNAR